MEKTNRARASFRFSMVQVLSVLTIAICVPRVGHADTPSETERTTFERGAVVSQSALASEAGAAILRAGGNAIDAAVATAFALSVTHPNAGNIGGGGFLVVLLPDGSTTSFDFREKAPAAATASMFLDADGNYDREKHHFSHSAVGVPGSVSGLFLAHRRLGRLPWRTLLAEAVQLATEGFEISAGMAADLERVIADFRKYPASKAQFTLVGEPMPEGHRLVQKDLAECLIRIRDQGAEGFYRGKTADLLVAEMKRGGGLITHEDLEAYQAVERTPVRGSFREFEIISMPPPSSGGVALIEMLNILEDFKFSTSPERPSREIHHIVEAMRRAFADRALHLGDPDFVKVPIAKLTSKAHAVERRDEIRKDRASKSTPSTFTWPNESKQTTHLSVVDNERMAVSLTTTLEYSYGSRIVVTGGGFLLNNEMGDFNPKAGWTSTEGAIGTQANLVSPHKRMLSSMTPAIVAKDAAPVLVIGSPGGRTIINTVLLTILNHVVRGQSIQKAVDELRFHHQWLPDRILAERGAFSEKVRKQLESLGHKVDVNSEPQGSAMGLAITADGHIEAGVDRRRYDAGAAGH